MFLGDIGESFWSRLLPPDAIKVIHGDLKNLPIGKQELRLGKLWFNVFEAKAEVADGRLWEAHQEFADLQIVLTGTEYCLLDDPALCILENISAPGEALFRHESPCFQQIYLTPGKALLIPPQAVHLPAVLSPGFSGKYKKMVIKIHTSLLA